MYRGKKFSAADAAEKYLRGRRKGSSNREMTEWIASLDPNKYDVSPLAIQLAQYAVALNAIIDAFHETEKSWHELEDASKKLEQTRRESFLCMLELVKESLELIGIDISRGDTTSAYKNICLLLNSAREAHDLPEKFRETMYRSRVRVWSLEGISEGRRQQLERLDYTDYLKTDEWRWTRERAFVHYGKECAVCRTKHDLEVHHRGNIYPSRGKETESDLIVLCHKYHAMYHGKAPQESK